MERIANIILCVLGIGWAAALCLVSVRVFVCDQFVVPSTSMEPTLTVGDRILANKLLFGARIYTNFEFGEDIPLESWRMPRLRRIKPNDIVVFNAPHGFDRNRIEFKINYVYVKRCVGTPGDTISIRNGFFHNSEYAGPIGDVAQQRLLASIPDSMLSRGVMQAYPNDEECFGWTIKNSGPLYVPRKGDSIEMNARNRRLYGIITEYETGCDASRIDGYYTFRENYYFLCGDNVIDSKDSRYLGFVPEEFIIGMVNRISYSRNPYKNKIRPNRIWKRVNDNYDE